MSKRGDTYSGGSTIIERGGRWPKDTQPKGKFVAKSKRFSGEGNAKKLEAARVQAVEDAIFQTRKSLAAHKKAELRMVRLMEQNEKARALAARGSAVVSRPKAKPKRKGNVALISQSEQVARLARDAEVMRQRVAVTIKPRGDSRAVGKTGGRSPGAKRPK